MALFIYKGTTKKILLTLKDIAGDAIDANSVENVEIYLRSLKTGELYAKYSISVQDGFLSATIEGTQVQVAIDVDITTEMDVGELLIITKTYITDADFDGGEAIVPNKGVLAYVKEM